MPSFQKSFNYSGSNAQDLSLHFPSLTEFPIELQLPLYTYSSGSDVAGNGPGRERTATKNLKGKAQVNDKDYNIPYSVDQVYGKDPVGFLNYYYRAFIQLVSGAETEEDLDDLLLDVGEQVGGVPGDGFKALPIVFLQANTQTIRNNVLMTMVRSDAGSRKGVISDYLNKQLFLINVDALKTIRDKMQIVPLGKLLAMVSVSANTESGLVPRFKLPAFDKLNAILAASFHSNVTDTEYNRFKAVGAELFPELFNFPVNAQEIKPLVVKGKFSIKTDEMVRYADLLNYDLIVELSYFKDGNGHSRTESVRYTWGKTDAAEIVGKSVDFDFVENGELAVDLNSLEAVDVMVKRYDGSQVWIGSYTPAEEILQALDISVPLYKVPVLTADDEGGQGKTLNLPLKGQVVGLTGQCSLNELTVIIQAKVKATDPIWKVVAAAKTDVTGSFTMPYPQGIYEVAQAIVSIDPNNPIDIGMLPPPGYQNAGQGVMPEFIYLMVDDTNCQETDAETEDDCDCHASGSKTPRLPDQKDLIGSDKYSQDLGGGACINLTTPNRTLSESTYFAIVRTSDPDVANYVLQKTVTTEADGFQKAAFSLGDGVKIKRSEVSFENAIHWQDAPDTSDKDNHMSIYQSVNVAHGHLLHYKSVLKADGYSLGDLLYSLPLAPGQKKQIVVYDWSRSLQASETQQLTQREGLTAALVNDRSIIDNLSGSINEFLQGQSTASTGGVSAGLGVGAILGPVGAVLGVSGGYSSSSSNASQQGSRDTVQAFGETLRNAIMQSASSYRQLNGTLIDTVREGQQYATTTEVVANHNHCHSLTMLYFEVLRHYAVFQELVQVEECIFVPLIMTNFTMENIRKWRDVLAANLKFRPSNTFLRLFRNANPLLKAFDANERVLTNWANVDFPTGRYCDERMLEITGQINFRVNIRRPRTRFDRILSLPMIKKTVTTQGGVDVIGTIDENIKNAVIGAIVPCAAGGPSIKREQNTSEVMTRGMIFDMFMSLDANYETVPPAECIRVNFDAVDTPTIPIIFFNNQATPLDFFAGMTKEKELWDSYASLLGMSTNELLRYFNKNVIADWDRIFNDTIAPMIIKALVNENRISISPFGILDITAIDRYNGGDRLLRYNLRDSTSLTRAAVTRLDVNYNISFTNKAAFFDYSDIRVESLKLNYSSDHYNGTIVDKYLGNDLVDGVQNIITPLNSDEKRNPRKEDKFLVNELVSHLNANVEFYNKVLWWNLDPDRRYLLLDGFHIQVYDDLNQPGPFKSLASIVKNQMIGIAGNALIFPVAAGVKVDRSYISVFTGDNEERKISLFDHYRPLTPPDPFRISVPTRGIYVEAVQGACDACEKVKDNSSQDWTKFTADEPTAIAQVPVPTPVATDWKATFKDFAPPLVSIQNAPALPEPGAGLAGLSNLLGKSDIFKDITGLDANQKNAMATYLSNQENAKAFAQMAKDMAMQAHNTQNDDKIKGAITDAQKGGLITKDDASKLTKDHIQQMIDGGDTKRAEEVKAAASKPSLTDAAVKAVDQGKSVKAESTDTSTGKIEKVDIQGDSKETVLAEVAGIVPLLQQPNDMACWATASTMMMSWKKSKSMPIEDVLALAGNEYVDKFNNGQGLPSTEKDAFISGLGMVGEPPASYTLQTFVNWIKTYGPLWVTTDSSIGAGDFSPHARILKKIVATGTADQDNTFFIFNDPATGAEVRESFSAFLKAYEQMVTDNPSDKLFVQIVHFTDTVESAPSEGAGADAYVQALNNYVPTQSDAIVINKMEYKSVTGVHNWKESGVPHNKNIIGKAKRTATQIIHLVLHETAADQGDGFAGNYTAHFSVKADASILQFNDLMELEYHGNSFNDSSIGIEFVNRGWLASPKTKYKDKADGTIKNCPARNDNSPCNGCEDCDSKFPLYSYNHEAIPASESALTADQKTKFKEADGYMWCFWGMGFNIYKMPKNTAQLEKEVELVRWLTDDLRKAAKAWKDGGGWLSGKPELATLATWLSLPAVPNVNQPVLDLFQIDSTWLQLVSFDDVKNVWTFKPANIPADPDKAVKKFFIFTTGFDYLTIANMATTSGIVSHNAIYTGHSDGSYLSLYTWLRIAKNKSQADAVRLCTSLMKDHFFLVSVNSSPSNAKKLVVLLDVSDANLV